MQDLDLSWLSHNPQSNELHVVQSKYQQQPSNMIPLLPSVSSSKLLHPNSDHPITNGLQDLLNSSTAHNCQQLLEDPIKRKPGRKPKDASCTTMLISHSSPDQEFAATMNGAVVYDKMEGRKFKNREAADQSRKRLKDRSSALEGYTTRLTSENDALRLHLQNLEQEETAGKSGAEKVIGLGMKIH